MPSFDIVVVAHVRSDGAAQGGTGESVGIGVVRDTVGDGGELRSFGRQSCGGRTADGGGNVVYRHHEKRARIYRTKNKEYKLPVLRCIINRLTGRNNAGCRIYLKQCDETCYEKLGKQVGQGRERCSEYAEVFM